MQNREYWLDLFTAATWEEFNTAGGKVSGFRETRWKIVQKMKPGDYLLCYLTGISRFIGILEITGAPYKDSTPNRKDEEFPCRVPVKPIVRLSPETALPVMHLSEVLAIFQGLKKPSSLDWLFQGIPCAMV